MGTCESLIKTEKKTSNIKKKDNLGTPYYAAPIGKNNITSGPSNLTYSTMFSSRDLSYNRPKMVKYCPKYADRSQRSLVKASLVELGQNSIMGNNKGNSTVNLTLNNSIYCDEIIREQNENAEDSEVEVIYEGKVDENIINKANEKNILDNYNYYIMNNDNSESKNIAKTETGLYRMMNKMKS